MKIALITASPRPIPATQGGATQTMMTHLIDVNEEVKEHDFFVFSYYEKEAEREAQKYKHSKFFFYAPCNIVDTAYSYFYRLLRKLSSERIYVRERFTKWCASIINNSNFDVVILEGNCFQVEYMRKLIHTRIILHMHIDRLNVELKASKRMIEVSDGIFAISEFCKKRMMEVVPSAENKIHVVKNTIDVDKFTYMGDVVRNRIRKQFGVKDNQKVISYCGRIDSNKGVLELIKAIRLLDDPNLHLLIIGSSVYKGSKKTSYCKKVEEEASKIRGGHTLTGYVSQSELPNYVSGSDLATVPSLCLEAAGNVTIEALSCGIPVVASGQGGIPEYADVSACRIVPFNENFVEGLATQIHDVLYNKDVYLKLKSNARSVAVQYDKHHYYIKFCNAVKKVVVR